MLTGEEYEALDEALGALGHELLTTPAQYAAAHYLPNWYPRLKGYTARSVWTEGTDPTEAWHAAQALGSPPWLVKDHVKSAKERWAEACFVPAEAAHLEFRLFFGHGRLLAAESSDDFDVDVPDFSAFERLARRIDARFFTLAGSPGFPRASIHESCSRPCWAWSGNPR
jgi:hypothetical protein